MSDELKQRTIHINFNPNNIRDRAILEYLTATELIYPVTTEIKNIVYEFIKGNRSVKREEKNYSNDSDSNNLYLIEIDKKISKVLEIIESREYEKKSSIKDIEQKVKMDEFLKGI